MSPRRVAILLLTFLLILTISGCGGGGATSAPPTTPIPPPVQPPTPPPANHFAGIFRASGTPGYAGTGKASAAPAVFAFARSAAAMAGLGTASLTMSDNRQNHAATLLQDGRVLITGGSKHVPIPNGMQMISLDSADIYDPSVERFYPVEARMSSIRSDHRSVLMSDGRVVVVGGTTGGGTNVEAIEVFDPESNSFSVKATAHRLPVGDFQAFDVGNGRILLYGGYNTDGPVIVDTTNWSTRVISTEQSHFRQCVAGIKMPDGKVMLSGGSWYYGSVNQDFDDILVFDPTSETFATVGKMSITRCGHSMLLLPDGKVGIYGGVQSSLTSEVWSPTVEIFDPATGKSATISNLVRPIYDANSTLLQDGRALHVGGWQNGSTISNAQIIYDHAAVTSGYTGAMTVARANFTMTTLNNGLILLVGGNGNGLDSDNVAKVHNNAEIFDPQSAIYLTLTKGAVPVGDPTPIQVQAHASGPVTWAASLGAIDGDGRYTAPMSVAEDMHNPTDMITATLLSDSSKKAQAFVTLLTDVVTISAPSRNVAPGSTLQLSARVAHYDDQRVQWSTTSGTIDETGLLTAPATSGWVMVKATSVANPAQSAQFGVEVK